MDGGASIPDELSLSQNMLSLLHIEDSTPQELSNFLQSSDAQRFSANFDLLNIIIRWVKNDHKRLEFAGKLLCHVDLTQISCIDLVRCVQPHDWLVSNPECHSQILEALNYNAAPHRQSVHCLSGPPNEYSQEVLIAAGGIQQQNGMMQLRVKSVMHLEPNQQQWTELSPLPEFVYSHSVTVLNDFFYVGGGSNHDVHHPVNQQISRRVHRYDSRSGKWTMCKPMLEKRAFFTLNALDSKLYAVGGLNHSSPMEESVSIEDMVETDTKPHLIIASITVESYDPLTDNWEYVAQLQFPTMLHASVVYGGKLYISGGCSMFDLNNVEDDVAILMTALSSNFCREFSNAVFCYDPRLASWEKRQPMSVERAGHRMCILSDKIFAIGGRNLMTSSGVECSVECYSPEKDEWNRLSVELPGPVVWHGIAAFDDNIFIVGGTKKCLDFEECEDLNLVQCYMTTEGVWYTVAKLPVGYAGAECCTIKLPQHKPVRQEFSPTEG